MATVGSLFIEEGDADVYVILKTKLGYLAVSIRNGSTYGGLQRTVAEVTYGLTPLGYKIDIDRTTKEGRQFQYE